jgi:TonB family protein
MTSSADSGPRVLLQWSESTDSRRYLRAGIGSLLVHAVLFVLALVFASLDTHRPLYTNQILADLGHATPLVDPPPQLTQKAPNRGKVAKEVDVEDLLPRPASQQRLPPAPARRIFQAPGPPIPAPPRPETQRVGEPPKLDAAIAAPQMQLPQAGPPKAPPPPQIQPAENPKLAFETPGQNGTEAEKSPPKIAPPKATVEEAIRGLKGGGGQGGGVAVGDLEQPPDLNPSLHLPPSPARSGSSLELLSDPQGVDFKPYLIRILALVRQNWMAVIPESARLGSRGVVLLQFIVDRNGQIPKLVIATPSGSEALDRAAVAGISASVPLPPLPPEFKGREVRLQFAFKYNVK